MGTSISPPELDCDFALDDELFGTGVSLEDESFGAGFEAGLEPLEVVHESVGP